MVNKVQKIREVVKKRYEYWKEKEFNSHSIESEARMSECKHLLLMLDSLQEEPVSDRLVFRAIPRLLDMIKPSERAKSYCYRLAYTLDSQGYHTDAKIVRENIKIMNGEKVAMATMDKEPVSEDLEEVAEKYMLEEDTYNSHIEYQIKGAFKAGANWQKKQDQETIELAEDHAMLAGIIKGTEHTIGEVRSILNKVAYENNGLDVNGDYCEQPYVELDNEFRKLLK